MTPAAACTLGIAPHSGWAAVVIIVGTAAAPRVLARERLELAEDRLIGSRQPYHAIEELPLPEARRRLARFEASAAGLAHAALERLLERVATDGAAARRRHPRLGEPKRHDARGNPRLACADPRRRRSALPRSAR
jgi:hypothetical protein